MKNQIHKINKNSFKLMEIHFNISNQIPLFKNEYYIILKNQYWVIGEKAYYYTSFINIDNEEALKEYEKLIRNNKEFGAKGKIRC